MKCPLDENKADSHEPALLLTFRDHKGLIYKI